MTIRLARLLLPCILSGLFSITAMSSAFAQESTADPIGTLIPLEECTAAPRPAGFLGDLVATPVSQDQYVSLTGVPDGIPADATVSAELTTAMREIIACSNTGEVLRALALFEDEYLRRTSDSTGELDVETARELSTTLATPIAMVPEQLVLFIGIHEIIQMADGRVAVVVETDGGVPNEEGTDIDLFIFKKFGENWLVVDALNDVDETEADS